MLDYMVSKQVVKSSASKFSGHVISSPPIRRFLCLLPRGPFGIFLPYQHSMCNLSSRLRNPQPVNARR